MAKLEYTFQGKAKYFLFRSLSKYGDNRMNFFPADDATRKAIKATGTKCGVKEDDGSKGAPEGFFYTFRNAPGKMVIEGVPEGALVGNDSDVTVTISVEQFVSPKFGPTARTLLEKVVVTNLVPYERPANKEQQGVSTDVPA